MPKRTKEEAREIINNIEEALKEFTGPDFKGEFSEDPKVRRAEQILLYYRLYTESFKKMEGENKERYINDCLTKIKSGEDKFARFVLSRDDAQQDIMLEELVMNDPTNNNRATIDLLFEKTEASGHEAEEFFDKVSKGLFTPKTDRTKLGYIYENRHIEELEKVQDEIDALVLPVPNGLSEDIVTQAVIGSYFSEDLLTQSYEKAYNVKYGSTLSKDIDFASGAVSLFFENMTMATEDRANMQAGRYFIPEARKRTAAALEAFSNGNKKPLADALMKGLQNSLDVCRYSTDISKHQFRNASRLAVAIYENLNSPAFKGVVQFTQEQKRWMDLISVSIKLNDEYSKLDMAVLKSMRDNYGSTENISDNFNLWRNVKRMVEIDWYKTNIGMQLGNLRDAITTDNVFDPKTADKMIFARSMFKMEKLAIDNPRALDAYLSEKALNSDVFKNFEKCKDWNEFIEFRSIKSVPDIGRRSEVIRERENYMMPQKIKRVIDLIKDTKYTDLRERLEALSCLKEGEELSEASTREQLKKRLDEYKKLDSFVRSNGYENISVVVSLPDDPEDVEYVLIGDQLAVALKSEIDVLEATMQKDPDEDRLESDIKIEDFMKALKANYDKNGKLNLLYDMNGKNIGFTDAYDMLRKGESFRLGTFNHDAFLGIAHTMRFDRKQMKVVSVKEDLVSREANIASVDRDVSTQIRKLKEVQEVLKISDPFFVSNSSKFNEAMKSFNTLVEAQERIGDNPNVRQVDTLLKLYDDLNNKVGAYVKEKEKSIKLGDDRGKLRLDTFKSLRSIINKQYVTEMVDFRYPERYDMKQQSEIAKPTVELMKKWSNEKAANAKPEKFCEAFDQVVAFAHEQDKNIFDRKYVKMAMSMDLEKMIDLRISLAKDGKAPEPAGYEMDFIKKFEASCMKEIRNFAQSDSRITLGMKPVAPKAEIGDPAGSKDPELEAVKHPDLGAI